jgi:hypothetical protein
MLNALRLNGPEEGPRRRDRVKHNYGLHAPRSRSQCFNRPEAAHLDVGVVGEVLDHLVPVLHAHAPIQLDALDARLFQPEMAQVQHGRELAEHQALGGGVVFRHQGNLLPLQRERFQGFGGCLVGLSQNILQHILSGTIRWLAKAKIKHEVVEYHALRNESALLHRSFFPHKESEVLFVGSSSRNTGFNITRAATAKAAMAPRPCSKCCRPKRARWNRSLRQALSLAR